MPVRTTTRRDGHHVWRRAAAIAVAAAALAAPGPGSVVGAVEADSSSPDASHELTILVLTPDTAAAGADVAVVAEGHCQTISSSCTNEVGSTQFTPALRYAPCAAAGCPAPQTLQDVCGAGGTDLTGDLVANTGSRQRMNNSQILHGTGTLPVGANALAPGTYVVCHSYRPRALWDIFTVVPA
ncbi:MAG: hypothetical protein ACRD03_03995 [Acidimicrobiales bacterium]